MDLAELSTGDVLLVDHIVLATGYRVDVAAVPYLTELPGLGTVDRFPILDDHMQSAFPALFVTGFAATHDFGPFFGFVRACPTAANIVVSHLLGRDEGRRQLVKGRPPPQRDGVVVDRPFPGGQGCLR